MALSDAVVAFEPRDRGGTRHSSIAALQMGKALFVVSAAHQGAKGRGLKQLVRLGAVALDPDRMPDAEALASCRALGRQERGPGALAERPAKHRQIGRHE